jgi:putative Ca2+/H+ antiporter (TMEM165/GDT1 family)
LAVLVGSQVSRLVNPQLVKVLAGAAFVLIGGYFIYTGLKA